MDSLGDPDYLCALASTFHDISPQARRIPSSADRISKTGELKRGAILDALARLIVYEPDSQNVALGAVLDSRGHIELYLAGDSDVPPKITQHLEDILGRLISIREAVEASPDSTAILECIAKYPFVPENTQYPAIAFLAELQRVLFKHSLACIRARLLKGARYDHFAHLVACINGVSADSRTDLSKGERLNLFAMQRSSDIRDMFARLDAIVSPVLKRLAEGDPDSEVNLEDLRWACRLMATMGGPLKDYMEYLDDFIHAYVVRITGTAPRKPVDTAKWLKKVSFVVVELGALVKIITRPSLSAMFGSRAPVHIVPSVSNARGHVRALTVENIKGTFAALGPRYTRESFVRDHPETFDGLVEEVEAAAKTEGKYVHCECALLCHLDQLGQAMMPYIGLSKSPCAFCDLFFAAYREHKAAVYTRETHRQTGPGPWKYPAFADNAEIETTFCEKLAEYIKVRLGDESARRWAGMHSQSTVASRNDGESFAFRV